MKKVFIVILIMLICLGGGIITWHYRGAAVLGKQIIHNETPVQSLPTTLLDTTSHTLFSIEGRGAEPFWYLIYSGGVLSWEAPSNTGNAILVTLYTGMAQTLSGNSYLLYTPSNDVTMSVTSGMCSDGMSDTQYPLKISIVFSGVQTQYEGCGSGVIY